MFGYVYYRQEKDDSLERGYLQKSIVLITRSNYVKLFTQVISIVGNAFFKYDERILEMAAVEISAWPKPYYNCNLKLPLLGNLIEFHIPPIRNGSLIFSPETSPKNNITVDLFKPLKNIFRKLTTLWELVLLNEPILVLSSNPTLSSNAVLALVSLISPLEYKGDFRPYITIHDHDFKNLSETTSFIDNERNKNTGMIIGGTNPYFYKVFENWTHILTIDENKVKTEDVPLDYQNKLKSKYKRLSKSDSNLIQKLMKSYDDESDIDYELKIHFHKKTEEFLKPFEDYFQTLIPKVPKFTPFGKLHEVRPFKETSFLSYISSLKLKVCDPLLYSKFLRTSNFIGWYKQKKNSWREQIENEYHFYMKTLDLNSYLKGKNECEIVDLILKAKIQLRDFNLKKNKTAEVIKEFIDSMMNLISPDLKQSLSKGQILV